MFSYKTLHLKPFPEQAAPVGAAEATPHGGDSSLGTAASGPGRLQRRAAEQPGPNQIITFISTIKCCPWTQLTFTFFLKTHE